MKKIKTLIARTIKNLGKLTAFALLIIPSFAICCILGSWTSNFNYSMYKANPVYNANSPSFTQGTMYYKADITNSYYINAESTTESYKYVELTSTSNSSITLYRTYNAAYGPKNSDLYTILKSTIYILVKDTDNKLKNVSTTLTSFYNAGNEIDYDGGYDLTEITYYDLTETFTDNTGYEYNKIITINVSANEDFWTETGYQVYGVRIVLNLYELGYNTINFKLGFTNNYIYYYGEYQNYINYKSNHSYSNEYVEQLQQNGYTIGYNQALQDIYNANKQPLLQATQNLVNNVSVGSINNNNEILGRAHADIYYDLQNNWLEVNNITSLTNASYNLITIGLVGTYHIESLKSNNGFTKIIVNTEEYTASYDGTYYIINQNALITSPMTQTIEIRIPTNITSTKYKIEVVNFSYSITENAFESGKQEGYETAREEYEGQINQIQTEYDTLLEHYQNAQLDNPLSKMVIAVADIPLNLFHSMFNFNILGFNLAAFILGIITILLVAYVIKLFL